ncbi:MAG: serine/threonine-protein kinase [Patulibacter minatonensis]
MHAPSDDTPWGRAPGLLLGRYESLGVIGRGGMGVVSRARDVRTGRLVAVKRVRGMDDRAQREAITSARLHHPAIVELIDARATGDGWIIVSELVDGADLRQVLRHGPVPELHVARYAGSILRGLAHAHETGVVHRDVKPANILCPRDPRAAGAWAKLTDFGVAALHGAETLTAVGDVVGTMAYMAPEQARGDRAGAPADVFALSVVVYEALVGHNPRRRDTPAETAVRALHPMPSLAEARPDLPPDVTDAVDLCLELDPADRGDLWDLDEGLRELAMAARTGARRRPERGRTRVAPAAAAPVVEPEAAHAPAAHDAHDATRHRGHAPAPAPPLPPDVAHPRPGQHPGDFALSPAGLGPQAAPGVGAWPQPQPGFGPEHASSDPPRLAVPGRMPKMPLRVLGTAGAAAVLGVITDATATPPVLIALAGLAFLVPRVTWVAIAVTTAALLAGPEPTAAAIAAVCVVAPLLLLPARPALWPAGGLAAGLAVLGGAGAWPALAAMAPRPATRIGLAVHGGLVAAVAAVALRTPAARRPARRPHDRRHHLCAPARRYLGRGGRAARRDRPRPHPRRRRDRRGALGRRRRRSHVRRPPRRRAPRALGRPGHRGRLRRRRPSRAPGAGPGPDLG